MMPVAEINAMPRQAFVQAFGDVAEHSPWVAEKAWQDHPFAGRDHLIRAFENALRQASSNAQLDLIRAHPDLATKARLTQDSAGEQASAGLDRLKPEEFRRFTVLNQAYKTRFGFPFIFAVKGATKDQILKAFERRVANSPETEFETALAQIFRIFRFRLEERVAP